MSVVVWVGHLFKKIHRSMSIWGPSGGNYVGQKSMLEILSPSTWKNIHSACSTESQRKSRCDEYRPFIETRIHSVQFKFPINLRILVSYGVSTNFYTPELATNNLSAISLLLMTQFIINWFFMTVCLNLSLHN